MTRCIALATLFLLIILVLSRAFQLKKLGIKAIQFGEMDKKDFFIPPFALLLFYIVFASAFGLPKIGVELFNNEFVGWVGVAVCVMGILLFMYALISFGKSFRVGLDEDHAGLVENIKRFGTTFAIIEHQIPYIRPMEKMLANECSYTQIDINTSQIIDISEAGRFLEINNIPARIIQTTEHSEDSISIVFNDGDAFIGDLYRQNLVMEDDFKSRESWELLKKSDVKRIYFAHGEEKYLN